jgi:hypothetical protein
MESKYENIAFPQPASIDYNMYFREQLLYFYLNLSRFNENYHIKELQREFIEVLKLLKKHIQMSMENGMGYLSLYYKLIGQTRDIFEGKGEQLATFMLIYSFYEVYPALAVYALFRLVKPINNEGITYGSWKDMKQFCQYIREQNENHELINICVSMMNDQLNKDIEIWKYSIHAGSRVHISFVSKWLPREGKKYDWLYKLLVLDWSKKKMSYIFNSLKEETQIKAFNKCKRNYRKVISFLNKKLDTTEIKQCSQKWEEIEPKHVCSNTSMKQRRMIFPSLSSSLLNIEDNVEERLNCSFKFKRHFENIFSSFSLKSSNKKMCESNQGSQISYKNSPNYFSLYYFVKEAIRLSKDLKRNELSIEYEAHVLNNQWKMMVNSFNNINFDNMLPILNVSFNMRKYDEESFYSGIGLALIIAEHSSFKNRIMVVDIVPTWIILSPIYNFISKVENIFNELESVSNTAFNLERAFDHVVYSMINSNSNTMFGNKLNLIVLSNFNNESISINEIVKIARDKVFEKTKYIPNLILWSLSKNKKLDLPDLLDFSKTFLLSGFSPKLVKALSFINKENNYNSNAYELICSILNDHRYDMFDHYLKKISSI